MSKKKGKLLLKVIIITVVLMVGLVVFIVYKFNDMRQTLVETKLSNIKLQNVKDGEYIGSYYKFLVGVKLKVKVKDHRIVKIEILDQRSGKGYEATGIMDRVIKKQSLKVDTITGATGSSKAILIAVDKALTCENK
ncbi:MAG: FMN-binding protein [Spirochaetes bacterium]|nr:FMN-binding protein [Spirochaetota bacterium]